LRRPSVASLARAHSVLSKRIRQRLRGGGFLFTQRGASMAYKVIRWDEDEGRVEVSGKDAANYRSFIFDISLVLQDPEPKVIVFQQKTATFLYEWTMSWEDFGKEQTIEDLALVNKKSFKRTKTRLTKQQSIQEGDNGEAEQEETTDDSLRLLE
jgi:hypothetical protein